MQPTHLEVLPAHIGVERSHAHQHNAQSLNTFLNALFAFAVRVYGFHSAWEGTTQCSCMRLSRSHRERCHTKQALQTLVLKPT